MDQQLKQVLGCNGTVLSTHKCMKMAETRDVATRFQDLDLQRERVLDEVIRGYHGVFHIVSPVMDVKSNPNASFYFFQNPHLHKWVEL